MLTAVRDYTVTLRRNKETAQQNDRLTIPVNVTTDDTLNETFLSSPLPQQASDQRAAIEQGQQPAIKGSSQAVNPKIYREAKNIYNSTASHPYAETPPFASNTSHREHFKNNIKPKIPKLLKPMLHSPIYWAHPISSKR